MRSMAPIKHQIEIADYHADFDDFYRYAEKLQQRLGLIYSDKVHDFDALYWVFKFKENLFVLNYDSFAGISIYLRDDGRSSELENSLLQELKKEIEGLDST